MKNSISEQVWAKPNVGVKKGKHVASGSRSVGKVRLPKIVLVFKVHDNVLSAPLQYQQPVRSLWLVIGACNVPAPNGHQEN